MNVVLVEPEIPQNTGNIGRLCVAAGTPLHLVGRLGFQIDDKHLKRAGMDYWEHLELHRHNTFEDLKNKCPKTASLYFFTTKVDRFYTEILYKQGDYIVFGSETKGLSKELREKHPGCDVKIPMIDGARSINLANAVSIVLYEALRQTNFFNCPPSP